MIGYLYRKSSWFRAAADKAFFNHQPNKDKALQEYAFYSVQANGSKVYNHFKEDFIQRFIKEQNKAKEIYNELDYMFTDLNGKKWYKYMKDQALPIERIGELEKYVTLMSAKLTGEELTMLCDKGIDLVEKGLTNGNNSIKVGALLMEIKDRKEMIIPYQLLLNRIAIMYVREDENPKVFDQKLHLEKVDQLMDEAKAQNGFFFQMPELKEETGLLNMSDKEWMHYTKMSTQQSEELLEAARIISSST